VIVHHQKSPSILLDGLTKFLVSVVTVVVSIYVFIKKKGLLKNTVLTVHSPSAVSTVFKSFGKERLTQTRRIDSQPDMF
jgi:hypothetical protein